MASGSRYEPISFFRKVYNILHIFVFMSVKKFINMIDELHSIGINTWEDTTIEIPEDDSPYWQDWTTYDSTLFNEWQENHPICFSKL